MRFPFTIVSGRASLVALSIALLAGCAGAGGGRSGSFGAVPAMSTQTMSTQTNLLQFGSGATGTSDARCSAQPVSDCGRNASYGHPRQSDHGLRRSSERVEPGRRLRSENGRLDADQVSGILQYQRVRSGHHADGLSRSSAAMRKRAKRTPTASSTTRRPRSISPSTLRQTCARPNRATSRSFTATTAMRPTKLSEITMP